MLKGSFGIGISSKVPSTSPNPKDSAVKPPIAPCNRKAASRKLFHWLDVVAGLDSMMMRYLIYGVNSRKNKINADSPFDDYWLLWLAEFKVSITVAAVT